jgi:hypothetical protein
MLYRHSRPTALPPEERPDFLAGAVYRGVLSALATRRAGMLPRACLAVICGGLVGGLWFHVVAGPDWRGYSAVAGLVEALPSLRWPRATASRQKDNQAIAPDAQPVRDELPSLASQHVQSRG